MGQPPANPQNRTTTSLRHASAAERALRVKLICQAVRAGTYRVSTGELADRFLARLASGELRTSAG